MPVSTREARDQILEGLGRAVDEAALSVACLGEAFELLTTAPADRLEAELFKPIQKAYATARRTHSSFAARCDIPVREFAPAEPGPPSQGAKTLIEKGVAAAFGSDHAIAELQDSMLPIEAGDPELRAGLIEVRELLGELPVASRDFLRSLGR